MMHCDPGAASGLSTAWQQRKPCLRVVPLSISNQPARAGPCRPVPARSGVIDRLWRGRRGSVELCCGGQRGGGRHGAARTEKGHAARRRAAGRPIASRSLGSPGPPGRARYVTVATAPGIISHRARYRALNLRRGLAMILLQYAKPPPPWVRGTLRIVVCGNAIRKFWKSIRNKEP